MHLIELARQVELLFEELEHKIKLFKMETGIRCLPMCFECCTSAKIQATILEFLPAAFEVQKRGELQYWIEKAESSLGKAPCIFLRPGKEGACSMYHKRGLICRLFGYSYLLDKSGRPHLLACKYIKSLWSKGNLSQELPHSSAAIASQYGLRLLGIDPGLGKEHYPLNLAILRALEMVGLRMNYRKAS